LKESASSRKRIRWLHRKTPIISRLGENSSGGGKVLSIYIVQHPDAAELVYPLFNMARSWAMQCRSGMTTVPESN
jgi:hypothetical protein